MEIPVTLILISVVSLTVFGLVVGTFSWGIKSGRPR